MQAKIKIYENRFYFYQWDKRQKLILNCAKSDSEVQFSNDKGDLITEKAYSSNGLVFVNVPDEILQSSGYIHVYVYITDKAGSYTKHVTQIQVKSRPKPSSYDDVVSDIPDEPEIIKLETPVIYLQIEEPEAPDVPDEPEIIKLETPVIYLHNPGSNVPSNDTTAILGNAILGLAVLGRSN